MPSGVWVTRIVRHVERPTPAPREPADVVGVDVHGEVRVGHETMHFHRIAVDRRHAEIDDLLAVLGIVAEEPVAELRDEAGAEEPP